MKVLVDALSIKNGGGISVLVGLVNALACSGLEVHLLLSSAHTLSEIDRGKRPASELTRRLHIHLREDLGSQWRALLFRLLRFRAFRASLAADVVLGFNSWTPGAHPQVTLHLNATPFLPPRQQIALIGTVRACMNIVLSRLALARSGLNIFESSHLLGEAQKAAGKITNAHVRYVGIDLPAARPYSKPEMHVVAITSGNAHKRNDLLIELHRRLNGNTDPGARVGLRLIASGQKEAVLQQLGAEDREYVGMQESIVFLPFLTREQLYAELAGSLALVSFSELESFFMVAIEAMAVGCPVVAARSSSLQESVGDAGLLVAQGDVGSARKQVEALMDPETRARISRISRSWAERFDGEGCMEQIAQLVHEFAEDSIKDRHARS